MTVNNGGFAMVFVKSATQCEYFAMFSASMCEFVSNRAVGIKTEIVTMAELPVIANPLTIYVFMLDTYEAVHAFYRQVHCAQPIVCSGVDGSYGSGGRQKLSPWPTRQIIVMCLPDVIKVGTPAASMVQTSASTLSARLLNAVSPSKRFPKKEVVGESTADAAILPDAKAASPRKPLPPIVVPPPSTRVNAADVVIAIDKVDNPELHTSSKTLSLPQLPTPGQDSPTTTAAGASRGSQGGVRSLRSLRVRRRRRGSGLENASAPAIARLPDAADREPRPAAAHKSHAPELRPRSADHRTREAPVIGRLDGQAHPDHKPRPEQKQQKPHADHKHKARVAELHPRPEDASKKRALMATAPPVLGPGASTTVPVPSATAAPKAKEAAAGVGEAPAPSPARPAATVSTRAGKRLSHIKVGSSRYDARERWRRAIITAARALPQYRMHLSLGRTQPVAQDLPMTGSDGCLSQHLRSVSLLRMFVVTKSSMPCFIHPSLFRRPSLSTCSS